MFARSRLNLHKARFTRTYGNARFATDPNRRITGQMIRDLWRVEGPESAATLLHRLCPADRARVEVEYWNLVGHVVTLTTIRRAFDVAIGQMR